MNVLETRVDRRPSRPLNFVVHEIVQMQAHLVFGCESVSVCAKDGAIVLDANEQSAAIGVADTSDGLDDRVLHPGIGLARMGVFSQRRFELNPS